MRLSSTAIALFVVSLALATASSHASEPAMKLEWSSRCLTAPGPEPSPLEFTINDVVATHRGKSYRLSDENLSARAGKGGGLTLHPSDKSFTLNLVVHRFPGGARAFASSVGGTQWRHDHAACGPENALDGNRGTAWRAGHLQSRDAWISVRFPRPTEMDEVEIVEALPLVVHKWRLVGQSSEADIPRVLAEGTELGAVRLPQAKGTWASLQLQLIESDGPPAIAEIIPKLKGVPVAPCAPEDRVEIDAVFSDGEGEAELRATTNMAAPILCRTVGEQNDDHKVLTMTSGPAESPSLTSLYDRQRDIALSFDAWNHSVRLVSGREPHAVHLVGKGYDIVSKAPSGQRLLGISARPYYFQSDLGVRFFRPIDKSSWPVAPTLAMTWYGIKAWESPTKQNHAVLDPEIEWVGRHLAPYGLSVFQFDDCYDRRDDPLMRSLSDKIRHEGMLPGLWFTPFCVGLPETVREHPDWFLADNSGNLISSFGGVSYRVNRQGGPTVNLSNPAAEQELFRAWWKRVNDRWNFDYFKTDGMPTVVDAYLRAANLDRTRFADPLLAIQRGEAIGREVVGATKYINLCWGIALDAMGYANGSRTGGDSGTYKHDIRTIVEWQYLNNTAWYCDPDSLSYCDQKTVEHTRLLAQARSLSGQQFITDETWTRLPAPIAHVLQHSIPMIDVRPAELYRIMDDWEQYDTFDLKITRNYGQWDVVGLFNYREEPKRQSLELSRLDLSPGKYHVWSFWEHKYLGEFDSKDTVRLPAAKPLEGRAYGVRPVGGKEPQLLATDRHTTMGGLDLIDYGCMPLGPGKWQVAGMSDHLVAGDPYRISLYAPNFHGSNGRSQNGTVDVAYSTDSPGVVEIVVVPEHDGVVWWQADFQEERVALARPVPARIELGVVAAGDTRSGVLEISCESKSNPVKSASAKDKWITLGKPEPFVAGKPVRIPYSVATKGLAADKDYASSIVLEMAQGVVPEKLEVPVALHTGAAMPKGKSFDELSKVHESLVISHEQGYGQLRINRSITGAPIILGGKTYATGLGSHAPQKTSYFIGGKGYRAFVATVGLDKTAATGNGQASVRFRVEVDGVERCQTPEMREDTPPITLVVDGLSKARTLTLICDSVGDQDYDHADWAEARLYR